MHHWRGGHSDRAERFEISSLADAKLQRTSGDRLNERRYIREVTVQKVPHKGLHVAWPAHLERGRAFAIQVRGYDKKRKLDAVIGVKVCEQQDVDVGRRNAEARQALRHPNAAVDNDLRITGLNKDRWVCAIRVWRRASGAQRRDLERLSHYSFSV